MGCLCPECDILPAMSERQEGDEEQERDALLRQLLKTPPQPRPQRERDKEKPTPKSGKRASGGKREPSA